MKISVVIPAFNAEPFLSRCLDSVLDAGAEVIVVDDGSIDGTAGLVRSRMSEERALRLISQPNAGVSAARNAGIAAALGEWLVFVDADDYLEDGALRRLSEMESPQSDIIVMRSFCGNEERYPWKENEQTYLRGSVCGCAFRRAFLEEKSLRFREGLSMSEDFLFFSECLNAGARLEFLDLLFYKVVEREGSASKRVGKDFFVTWGKTLKCASSVLDRQELRSEVCLRMIMGMCHAANQSGYLRRCLQQDIGLDTLLPLDDSSLNGKRKYLVKLLNFSFPLFFFVKKMRDSSFLGKFLLLVLLLCCPWMLDAGSIKLSRTEQMTSLGTEILRQVDAGEKDINVSFEPGTYYFPDNCISIISVDAPGVKISFDGNGASFIGEGKLCPPGSEAGEYSFSSGWTDLSTGMPTDMRGPVGLCRFYPIPTNFARTSFRIPTREKDLSEEEAKDVYVIITQWYKGIVFKVDKIKRGWIYYHETEASPTKWYTELRFGRCLPRYQLLNRPDGSTCIKGGHLHSEDSLYRSDASCFMRIRDSKLGSVSIRNCNFDGNRANEGSESMLFFFGTEADSIIVSHCRFRGIKGDALTLYDTDNFSFSGCEATLNYCRVFFADYKCSNIIVRDNDFRDNGLSFSNDPTVLCMAEDMLIEGNYFEDFTYSAISVGTHYTYDSGDMTSGYVRNNEICHSPSFRIHPMRSIIDGGAIYVYTQNKNLVVCDNYVHDIGGHHGNRGILCDDGVNNVCLMNNLILNIENGYPIDLRKYEKVKKMPGSYATKANHHNRVVSNIVDAKCRLYVRKDEPDSEIRDNVFLEEGYDRAEVLEKWKRRGGRL